MREIVDKFFPDNWVISYYMGICVDLPIAWESFKAARLAIANTLSLSNVNQQHQYFIAQCKSLCEKVEQLLLEV